MSTGADEDGRALAAFTVEGPIQAEILILVLGPDRLPALTGPCGAEPWFVEVAQGADPMVIAATMTRANVGEPLVLQSTSWRQARGGVVLTFVAVMDDAHVGDLPRQPVPRSELARGGATTAATDVATWAVVEHGLRHLAWLVKDDSIVRHQLAGDWQQVLANYVPEPFRHL